LTSVAAPIVDRHGTPIAALSVITRSQHTEPAVLTPAIIAVARAISRAMSAGT
jgi:DNA-binding IclR family transcriptional regulator